MQIFSVARAPMHQQAPWTNVRRAKKLSMVKLLTTDFVVFVSEELNRFRDLGDEDWKLQMQVGSRTQAIRLCISRCYCSRTHLVYFGLQYVIIYENHEYEEG
jgi:hypothetical protein